MRLTTLGLRCLFMLTAAACPALWAQSAPAPKVSLGGKDPASAIATGVTTLVPEMRGVFTWGEEFAVKLARLDYKELLPTHITPANFLDESKKIVRSGSGRDLASMGLEAARLALQIEDIKIGYLQRKLCTGGGVAQLSGHATEVEAGCKLLDLQLQLNHLKLQGLALVEGK